MTDIDFDEWPAYAPSQILPRLFQGGTDDDEVLGCPVPRSHYRRNSPFDLIVTLYADAMPAPWGVRELRFGFPDSRLDASSAAIALQLAATAYADWIAGARVLVRCQAGVNRSGLVTALILMLAGYEAREAISLIRAQRSPMALCNEDFERWLLEEAAEHIAAWTSQPSAA